MKYNRNNINSAIHAAERLSQSTNKKNYIYATAGGYGVYNCPPLSKYQDYYETTGWSTIFISRNIDRINA